MKNKFNTNENIQIYFDQIKVYPLLSFDEELELARLIQQGNQSAMDKLVNSNLRLAIKIARSYTAPDVPLMDLIQEGNIGLMYAAKKYDHEKKVRFCTYASWWIRQFINRYLTNKRRIVRLPHRKEEMLRKIQHTYYTLSQTLMHQPKTEDIADELGISVQEVNYIVNMSSGPIALEMDTSRDDTFSVIGVHEDYTYCPEKHLFKQYYREKAWHTLDRLKDRERQVLAYRYQLNGDGPHSLKEIGKKLNLSPETVRQIERRALAKIRSCVHALDFFGYQEAM
jgi:RNA polymerase primary sigma factor